MHAACVLICESKTHAYVTITMISDQTDRPKPRLSIFNLIYLYIKSIFNYLLDQKDRPKVIVAILPLV